MRYTAGTEMHTAAQAMSRLRRLGPIFNPIHSSIVRSAVTPLYFRATRSLTMHNLV